MKVFFPVFMDVGNLLNHIKSVCFFFCFSLIFHHNDYTTSYIYIDMILLHF